MNNPDIEKKIDKIEKQLHLIAKTSWGYEPYNDWINMSELWRVIWSGKWIIVAVTSILAVFSIVYALLLPDIYKSEVLLSPAEENSGRGLAGLAGQLGGLASLTGLNLGAGESDKTILALEVLESRDFLSKFIQTHDLVLPLMAAKGWNRNANTLVIDNDIYDPEKKVWVRDVSPPRLAMPSIQESVKKFREILVVSQNKKTNFVSISIEYYSPYLAKLWIDWLVEDLNEEVKSRDVNEAKKSIDYLSEQIQKTPISEMQSVFYELIEEQTKTVMFAEVRDEYVFNTVDKAFVPEEKVKPKRFLIVVLTIIIGLILSCSSIIILRYKLNGVDN